MNATYGTAASRAPSRRQTDYISCAISLANTHCSEGITVFYSDDVIIPIGGCDCYPVTDVHGIALMERHPSTHFHIDDIRAAGTRCRAGCCDFSLLPARHTPPYQLYYRGQSELIRVDKLVARPYAIEEDVAGKSLRTGGGISR